MLHALNNITSSKNKGTQTTRTTVKYFLDYAACNPEVEITFRASNILYKINSDAAHLVCPKAQSRAGEYHYLGNTDGNLFNGPIHVLVEVAGLFMNAQHAVPIHLTLEDMGHSQPSTPLRTNNLTAQGILSGVYKQKGQNVMT